MKRFQHGPLGGTALIACLFCASIASPGDGESPGNVRSAGLPDKMWTVTGTTNAPEARFFHAAIWTGREMIIWGGFNFDFGDFNTGARYNSASDSWTAVTTASAPTARALHSAVWTGSEMIVWGGRRRVTPDYRRQIQSKHRDLDSYQHRQRAVTTRDSQRRLDRQRDDRLGRIWMWW